MIVDLLDVAVFGYRFAPRFSLISHTTVYTAEGIYNLRILSYNQIYILDVYYVYSMTGQATVKIYAVKSRHTINLPSDFVRDSAFPFKVGEELVARIKDGKIVIEKKL